MNKFFLFLLAFTTTLFPQIDSIFNRISTDSLISSVKELTGIDPVLVNGKVDTIKTRYYMTTYNRLATEFISEKMKRTGLNSAIHQFHGESIGGADVEFTDIAFSNGDQFPLFLCMIGARFSSLMIFSLQLFLLLHLHYLI